jgi:hypothetical protein
MNSIELPLKLISQFSNLQHSFYFYSILTASPLFSHGNAGVHSSEKSNLMPRATRFMMGKARKNPANLMASAAQMMTLMATLMLSKNYPMVH